MDIARGFGRVSRVFLLASIGLTGCAPEEELKLDPGVSPFYPGVSATEGASTKTDGARDPLIGRSRGPRTPNDDVLVPTGPLRPDEVEKQVRIAMHAAQKGETVKAGLLLDQVLAIEPLNREALTGRAMLALDEANVASALPDRVAATGRSADLARTLHRIYDRPKKRETDLYARALAAEAKVRVVQGKFDQALATLKEATSSGLDAYFWVEQDEAMAPLRSSPQFQTVFKAFEESRLALARERVKDRLGKPLDFPFDFKLPNLENKSVSLADFKGKVVLLDLWGTWCGPCREAIPHLIELSRKYDRRGLAVVGLTYEKTDPTDPQTRETVKKFVQQAGIPYPVLMGDEPTLRLVPNLHGFPTLLVLDRAGKARLLVTENDPATLDYIHEVVLVLLAEPAPGAAKPK
jgi:thiol-disulfide isomerase/thioredoxin